MTLARELLETSRRELADVERDIRSHRFLEALEAGAVGHDTLRAFAGEQYWILTSDRRSFAYLAARFPEPPAGDLFLDLATGEGDALLHLGAFARALGLDGEHLRAYEPQPGPHAYTAYVAWLALNGSRSDVALAFLANLDAWGENCARMARALRARYELDAEAVAFFDFFATAPPGFEERALTAIEVGLAEGDRPERARRAARLLQAYELLFWDILAAGP